MFVLPVIIALVIPFVTAQSTSNDTTVQIEAIEAHFTQSNIVPALLATFNPSALLTINFDGWNMHFLFFIRDTYDVQKVLEMYLQVKHSVKTVSSTRCQVYQTYTRYL